MTTITKVEELAPAKRYASEAEAEWHANKIREELDGVLKRHGVTAALVTFAVFCEPKGDGIPKAMVLGTESDIPKLLNAAMHATSKSLAEIEERKGRS